MTCRFATKPYHVSFGYSTTSDYYNQRFDDEKKGAPDMSLFNGNIDIVFTKGFQCCVYVLSLWRAIVKIG